MNFLSFLRDCTKTSSKYLMELFFSISGMKILHINAENTTGPIEIPKNNLLNS